MQGALRLERGAAAWHTAAAVLAVVRPADGAGADGGRVHAVPGGAAQLGEVAALAAGPVCGDLSHAVAGRTGGRPFGGAQQAAGENRGVDL